MTIFEISCANGHAPVTKLLLSVKDDFNLKIEGCKIVHPFALA